MGPGRVLLQVPGRVPLRALGRAPNHLHPMLLFPRFRKGFLTASVEATITFTLHDSYVLEKSSTAPVWQVSHLESSFGSSLFVSFTKNIRILWILSYYSRESVDVQVLAR